MEKELLLLGLLRLQKMYGYQINEIIDRDLRFVTDLKRPTAYYILARMAKAGLVREEKARAGHRPERRVYQVTAAGEAEFQRLLRENVRHYQRSHAPGDIGLVLLSALPPDEAKDLLLQRQREVQAEIDLLQDSLGLHRPETGRYCLEVMLARLRAEADYLGRLAQQLDRSPAAADASGDVGPAAPSSSPTAPRAAR
ncbi:MAG: PadR family transcriptional regulator [Firmicutes bacterium]|nr:PadR family transcriptional regulator [Bacillota bacterium]